MTVLIEQVYMDEIKIGDWVKYATWSQYYCVTAKRKGSVSIDSAKPIDNPEFQNFSDVLTKYQGLPFRSNYSIGKEYTRPFTRIIEFLPYDPEQQPYNEDDI